MHIFNVSLILSTFALVSGQASNSTNQDVCRSVSTVPISLQDVSIEVAFFIKTCLIFIVKHANKWQIRTMLYCKNQITTINIFKHWKYLY